MDDVSPGEDKHARGEQVKEALRVLDATLRGDLAFDSERIERIENLFRALPDEEASKDLVQGLMNVQLVLYQEMQNRRAVPAGLRAVRWARQLGDRTLLARALSYQALSAGENFDLSLSFEAYLESLQIGKELEDSYIMSAAYASLGGVMRRLGRDRASLACINAALNCAGTRDGKFIRVRACALANLADYHLKRLSWEAALEAAGSAQSLLIDNDSTDSVLHAVVISNEVSARVQLCDFEGAKKGIERLRTLTDKHPSMASDCYLRQAEALYESFVGDPAAAAEELSKLRHIPIMRDTAMQDLIDMYERAGNPGGALEVTHELLNHLRAARREVTEADLSRISIAPLDDVDHEISDLIKRCGRFEVEVSKLGDKLHAKLGYLFDLAVNAELREEDGAKAGEHIFRVGRLCANLAKDSGCDPDTCWLAEVAGRTHDIGKTSLPSQIVMKVGPLTPGERALVSVHAEDGASLVAQLGEARLVQVVAAVRHHHERWDGTGYPGGLAGERIPLLARIVAICDSFDAMTHARSYRKARSIREGLVEIERCAGTQFDPLIAGRFVALVKRLQRDNPDLDQYLGESGRHTRWAKCSPELSRALDPQLVESVTDLPAR